MSVPLLSTSDAVGSVRPAIEVDDVSASYHVRANHRAGWWGLRRLVDGNGSGNGRREVPALRDITFSVPKGSVLGVIGRNGAGKSTLLRILAGILAPRQGRVIVRGRISPLLSVGLGMQPELSGRENIRLGCLAFGHSADQLEDLTASIASFAQLGEYVDYPFRAYSSGMRARLGFAVAAHLDPEILLIDEALTGGDSKFKEKTAEKMFELCDNGRTIVVVTHTLSFVRMMATSAMWLHQGRLVEYGDPDDVVNAYMRYCRIDAAAIEIFDDD
jgi:ABC-2 type transport system ATP-binding protein/teichoic acid transport system ATP-binding protein